MALPYAYRVSRVTISGHMFGGAEEWSTGFYFGNGGADAELPTQAFADAVRDAWTTYFTNAQSYISNLYTSELVKVSSFGTDGKSDANDTVYSSFPANTKGARAEILPPQCTMAATLLGVNNRGLGTKGRMYLPGVVIGVTNTGQTDPFNTNLMCVNFKNFLTAVNAFPGSPNVVVLASHGQLVKGPAGNMIPKVGGYGPVTHEVTAVQIGTVYDTQRRRRNGLNEQYQRNALGAA